MLLRTISRACTEHTAHKSCKGRTTPTVSKKGSFAPCLFQNFIVLLLRNFSPIFNPHLSSGTVDKQVHMFFLSQDCLLAQKFLSFIFFPPGKPKKSNQLQLLRHFLLHFHRPDKVSYFFFLVSFHSKDFPNCLHSLVLLISCSHPVIKHQMEPSLFSSLRTKQRRNSDRSLNRHCLLGLFCVISIIIILLFHPIALIYFPGFLKKPDLTN